LSDLSQRLSPALSDRYRIERELGRGGMATVFLAEDLKHRRRVAIKVLDPEVAAAIGPERFLREIETVARLSHPHILPMHDSGQAHGLLFYVMPYVEGDSLRDRLAREKQLPLEEALGLTREIAAALEHAHRQGVVHRDIKPENILLQSGHAVVADFGVARAVAAGSAKLTATGVMVGTPVYMSPEQAAGGRDVDGRSDQYSLGCVLYELLAGQAPFTGPTAESIVFQHLNAPPPHVTAIRPALPVALDRVIVRALAKSPADRFATVAEFVTALDTALTAGPEATRRDVRRGAAWSAAIIAGAVIALVAVAAWQQWWPFGGETTAPPAKKAWILVADFQGPANDSSLAATARDLLSAAIDQSKSVATVSREQVQQALQAAGKPPGTRVTTELARELAYRSAVRAVLEGKLGRIGSGYSIVLRAVDADSARTIVTANGTAQSADALIPTLGELAKQLRRGLGENREAIASSRPMVLVATPSFEAYQLYVRAQESLSRLELVQTIQRCRAALALDPDFAMAWAAMRLPYSYMGYPDSMLLVCDEALRRPGRLTSEQRAQILNYRLAASGDEQGALDAIDRILLENPDDLWALRAGNDYLWDSDRFEDALTRVRRWERLAPFGPDDHALIDEFWALYPLGRFDEARQVARRETGMVGSMQAAYCCLGEGNFAAAESIGRALQRDPRCKLEGPTLPGVLIGFALAGRGACRAADSCLAVVEKGDPAGRSRILLAIVRTAPLPQWQAAPGRDTTTVALFSRGLREAFGGDTALARRCLGRALRRPAYQHWHSGASAQLIEARLDGAGGRWDVAARLLQPIAVRRVAPDYLDFQEMSWIRWYLADAYEHLGQPDSAAAHLERIVSDPFANHIRPYAHLRLVPLDARLGRGADARRHMESVQRAFTTPDPELKQRIEQARAQVANLR
jgi:tRNA A-37 threonylcarbamoyl transferase component Bud32/tetratricopeptide (TPR) repeat protein